VTWATGTAELTAPLIVAELEIAEPPRVESPLADSASLVQSDLEVLGTAERALVLVRLGGVPLGTIVVDAPRGRIDPEQCRQLACEQLEPAIRGQVLARSQPVDVLTGMEPLAQQGLREDVPVTVVVATRERPGLLADCLKSLSQLDYPQYEVVVVDNDPVSDDTKHLLSTQPSNVRYVVERQRGLAAAHNRGLAVAAGKVVAFTDDDVVADRDWLTNICKGMRRRSDVACVTGLIMPAELVTPAQLSLELHGGFNKGFAPRLVNMTDHRPADLLFPFTVGQLGSGANMSFDTDALRRLGGFDPAIGTGTFARGGDDLAALFDVLASGYSIAYEPGALVWHRHRRDAASLNAQAYGYGVGLSAYLTSALLKHPRMIASALARGPAGVKYALHSTADNNGHAGHARSREMARLQRKGMAFGPIAYAVSARRTRRALRGIS
jgi:GT2 family glycosyltransferase